MPTYDPTYDRRVLRTWHLESGKTLEEVAFRARCSYTHLRRLRDVGGNPSAELLARIAAVYGRDVRELFTPDRAGAR
jgi:transcriptional regulator with XRE-family HTH domain